MRSISRRPSLRNRVVSIIRRLKKAHPDARVALHYTNPLELLIATILSAQCTDERVNMVTPALFARYRSAHDYASANRRELESEIHSTGFYRAKAKNIIACCKKLAEEYRGNVPGTMRELISLPGVGRKTANVILGSVFSVAEGIVVDTHVARLSQRLGLSKHANPEKIERDLMNVVPQKDWIAIGHLLIWHGRRVCQARRPKCLECPINDLCPSFGKFVKAL